MSPSANGRPLLRTEDVTAGYTDVDILHGVTVEMESGEMVAIIGPNGAGKSTLIKTIAGLLRARTGRILFDGIDITRMRTNEIARHGLSYVPQLDNIFPSLTVEENLQMGAFTEPRAMRERLARVYETLPLLGQRRRQRGGTMSGGERQMLALGRALMSAPTLLILDEPSAGLAPTIVDSLFETVHRLNSTGLAILLVEQNARRALAMSHRGYVLDLGKNRYEGPGDALLHDPLVIECYLGGGRRLEENLPSEEQHIEG